MPVSGNGPEGLKQMLKGLEELTSKRYLRQMSNSLGAEVVARIKEGFDTSTDPYGNAWKPVRRGGLPLRNTGRLKNAWTYLAGHVGVVVAVNNLIQANMMQYGTAGLPGGKLTPKNKQALRFDVPGSKPRGRNRQWQPTVTVKSVVIAARPMIPSEGDVPPRWEQKLRATADKVMEVIAKAKAG